MQLESLTYWTHCMTAVLEFESSCMLFLLQCTHESLHKSRTMFKLLHIVGVNSPEQLLTVPWGLLGLFKMMLSRSRLELVYTYWLWCMISHKYLKSAILNQKIHQGCFSYLTKLFWSHRRRYTTVFTDWVELFKSSSPNFSDDVAKTKNSTNATKKFLKFCGTK